MAFVLQTLCYAQYLTRDVGAMRRVDYDATHLVKAVKGLDLNPNSYTWVMIDGKNHKITSATKDDAIGWFATWAATRIDALGSQPKVLIPIPSSKTTANSPEDFRTFKIATAIAGRAKACTVKSTLRFIESRPSSREDGGSRDPAILYPNMTMIGSVPPGEVVFVDDVMTSGGHFVAAALKFADMNRTPKLAIACGRSLDTQLDDPFVVAPEDIDIEMP